MSRIPMLLAASISLVLPFAAAAQDKPFGGYPNADMEYCAKLSDLYIRYIGRSEAGPRTPVTPDVVGGVA